MFGVYTMPKIQISEEAFQLLILEAKKQGVTMQDLASSSIVMVLSEESEEEEETEETEEEEEEETG